MNIQRRESGKKGSFFIEQNGIAVAEMVYSIPMPGKMIIEHTEVDDALRGQNIGYQLVHAGVEYARANHLKIVPLCPFANAVFKKRPAFADVLYQQP